MALFAAEGVGRARAAHGRTGLIRTTLALTGCRTTIGHANRPSARGESRWHDGALTPLHGPQAGGTPMTTGRQGRNKARTTMHAVQNVVRNSMAEWWPSPPRPRIN